MATDPRQRPFIVAIDGPAGSGKSTVARRVALALGLTYLDTGAIYRALALRARRDGVDWADAQRLAQLARSLEISFTADDSRQRVWLEREDVTDAIREPAISPGASQVSRWPEVREALLQLQRDVALRGGVVAEGRDTGTVVFPEAQLKVFLVADPEVRAQRRLADLRAAGHDLSLAEVLEAQNARDEADSGRAVAPLRAAVDARKLDTSALTADQVVDRIVALCRSVQSVSSHAQVKRER